jgi:hypothetical protein
MLELHDDEPLLDVETSSGTAGFGGPLDLVVDKIDEAGDLTPIWDRSPAAW